MNRPLLRSALAALLLGAACSHAPAPARAGWVPPAVSLDLDPAYAQHVRQVLGGRSDELQACEAQARSQGAPEEALATSPLYVSPGIAYFPRRSSSPFLSAFEQCLLERLRREPLPAQVSLEYAAAWVRVRFTPGGPPPSIEVSNRAPDRVNATTLAPGTVPDRTRDVYAFREQLGRPRRLSGERIQYTQEALVHGVEGVMVVKCVLTWAGTLEDCRIAKPLPDMEEAVLRTLAGSRYTPLTFEGTPLNVDYTFVIQLKHPR
ncbi:hypothetical protein FGE12_23935 [Aggregicoccus sp. 17bor-14]|uniref:energy transducer TonB n=1 Tax=Myxococcaceae TaxID=31 RepID=UPI00129C4A25|nr:MULTISPECIES: energy transducer TonB [Myxococcaceae]MBF5045479.1 energy transducer TonB [Simulacricoccus sp. 17bor-14]MRI91217.1 hypothetical protein [Aggregicoccus sp. 17bor-14]